MNNSDLYWKLLANYADTLTDEQLAELMDGLGKHPLPFMISEPDEENL